MVEQVEHPHHANGPTIAWSATTTRCAAANTDRVVNIKKGQSLAPDEVRHAVAKHAEVRVNG